MPMEKTFQAADAEGRIYDAWEQAGCFVAGANASRPETFCVMIPPPNVTGSLHMGHAFNNTLQDILVRWHRMRGFDTLWQPGTDHAGIATQMVTERDMMEHQEPNRQTMGREKFTQRVWQQKIKSRGTIIGQLKRLGASCDWSREAFTMSGAPGAPEGEGGNFHDAVIKVFVDMYDKGLIHRGKRLVNWDPHFETAISDLEVENIETDGHMWHFKYPLAGGATYEYVEKDEDGVEILRETRDYISIATTRPETMLGDGAVAVNPTDARYASIVGQLCEIPVGPKEHRRLIPIITDDYPDPDFGSGAVKITGAHDFNDYAVAMRNRIPLYALLDTKGAMRADGLSYEDSAKQASDYAREWVEMHHATESRFQSPSEHPVPDVSQINLVPDDYRGLDRFEARKKIVADITDEGLAVMVNPDGTPVATATPAASGEPAPSPGTPSAPGGAASASGLTLGEKAAGKLAEVFGVQGGPGSPETRAAGAGDDAADAGAPTTETAENPIPLVENKKIMQPFGDRSKVVIEPMLTDQWFVDTARIVKPAIDAVKSGEVTILPEQDRKVYFNWLENIEPWCISRQLWWGHQIPVWYDDLGNEYCAQTEDDAQSLAREQTGAETVALTRDPDVLDTWFSSGLWPIGTLGWPEETDALKKYFPTSTLITGFDIIFFWVARMMMMQYAVTGQRPFDTVYVHALVRDEKGKKMSKSLGNVLDPLELIDEYGTDAVRFTLTAMASMGRDLKLSTARIAGNRNFGTKLWNAFRFAEMNDAQTYILTPEMYKTYVSHPEQTVNRWIMGETANVRAEVDEALGAYRFNDAANALYVFVWGKVCDWYVELSKPLLLDGTEAEKTETRQTLAWVLDQCLILLHPIMPFITEELWGQNPDREKMLIHADWPGYGDEIIDETADAEMNWVIALIEGIRSVRGEMNVPAALKVDLLMLDLDEQGEKAFENNAPMIEKLARLGSVTRADTPPKGSATIPVKGGTFALPLADIIDVSAEKARLSKSLQKVEKEVAGLQGRLKNPKFRENAAPEVVEETEAQAAVKTEEKQRLQSALTRLGEIG